MSTTARPNAAADMWHSRWTLPIFSVSCGVALFVASAIGGHAGVGLAMLGLMTAFGAAVLLSGRSELIRGLRGDGRDERFAMMDLRATAFAGLVLVTTVIIAFIVELARGYDGQPFTWLGAVGGVAYIVGIALERARS